MIRTLFLFFLLSPSTVFAFETYWSSCTIPHMLANGAYCGDVHIQPPGPEHHSFDFCEIGYDGRGYKRGFICGIDFGGSVFQGVMNDFSVAVSRPTDPTGLKTFLLGYHLDIAYNIYLGSKSLFGIDAYAICIKNPREVGIKPPIPYWRLLYQNRYGTSLFLLSDYAKSCTGPIPDDTDTPESLLGTSSLSDSVMSSDFIDKINKADRLSDAKLYANEIFFCPPGDGRLGCNSCVQSSTTVAAVKECICSNPSVKDDPSLVQGCREPLTGGESARQAAKGSDAAAKAANAAAKAADANFQTAIENYIKCDPNDVACLDAASKAVQDAANASKDAHAVANTALDKATGTGSYSGSSPNSSDCSGSGSGNKAPYGGALSPSNPRPSCAAYEQGAQACFKALGGSGSQGNLTCMDHHDASVTTANDGYISIDSNGTPLFKLGYEKNGRYWPYSCPLDNGSGASGSGTSGSGTSGTGTSPCSSGTGSGTSGTGTSGTGTSGTGTSGTGTATGDAAAIIEALNVDTKSIVDNLSTDFSKLDSSLTADFTALSNEFRKDTKDVTTSIDTLSNALVSEGRTNTKGVVDAINKDMATLDKDTNAGFKGVTDILTKTDAAPVVTSDKLYHSHYSDKTLLDIWNSKKPALDNSVFFSSLRKMTFTDSGGGQCPFVGELPGVHTKFVSASPARLDFYICDGLLLIRALVLISAALSARALLFGG